MRSILSIIALFSCCTLAAQEYIPTYGRELPRGEVIAYPTAQEAAAASAGDTRYFTRLADWTQKTTFSRPSSPYRSHGPTGRYSSIWDGLRLITKCA